MQPMSEVRFEYAKEFWSLSNAIVGFAVLQMIAYLLSAGSSGSTIEPGIVQIRPYVLVGIVLGTLFYSFVVWFLARWQIQLLLAISDSDLSKYLGLISKMRIAVIVVTGLAGLWITWILK
jgi:hypothetical protein